MNLVHLKVDLKVHLMVAMKVKQMALLWELLKVDHLVVMKVD